MKSFKHWMFPAAAAATALTALAVWRIVDGRGDAVAQQATPQDEAKSGKSPGVAGRPALAVSVVQPQTADWPLTLAASGSIAAWQEAAVGAEISGYRVAEVRVNVGDKVRRGQVLARLAADAIAAELALARAGTAEAEASLAEAQANADRARQMEKSGALSAQQITQYLTAAQTAAARVEAARARQRSEELKLSHTRVLAPDDGVISARLATVGAVTAPGVDLFRLVRQGRLEWRAEVPAQDTVRIKAGTPAVLTLGEQTIAGKVRVVAPTVDPSTRNGLVYVDLPAGAPVRAGMFSRGELELGRAPALTLPQSAVVLREGFSYVYRVDNDSRVVQMKVNLGRRSGERVEVVSGLDVQARVVERGAGFLSDGDLVRVVDGARTAGVTPAPAAPAVRR
jgi:RND family efflux transporter MFP subunit